MTTIERGRRQIAKEEIAMTKTTATFSAEAFNEAMNLMEFVGYHLTEGARQEAQRRLFEVMRLTAESAGQVTIEEEDDEEIDDPVLAGRYRMWVTEEIPHCEYDTVLGWLAKHAPHYLSNLDDPVEETQRDGFWLSNVCYKDGHAVYKVPSPIGVYDHQPWIHEVNAYPKELIAERFRRKGVI